MKICDRCFNNGDIKPAITDLSTSYESNGWHVCMSCYLFVKGVIEDTGSKEKDTDKPKKEKKRGPGRPPKTAE